MYFIASSEMTPHTRMCAAWQTRGDLGWGLACGGRQLKQYIEVAMSEKET